MQSGRQPRIIVVDDDPEVAEAVREILTIEGYQIEVCADGEQAFSRIQAVMPELIILDVMMPGLGGFGLLYLLSGDPRTRRLPVLLCTGVDASALEPWRELFAQQGRPTADVLAKPFTVDQLVRRVEGLLDAPGDPAGRPTPPLEAAVLGPL